MGRGGEVGDLINGGDVAYLEMRDLGKQAKGEEGEEGRAHIFHRVLEPKSTSFRTNTLPSAISLEGPRRKTRCVTLAHEVIRYTRRWLHYGMLAHVTICIVIAALEHVLRLQ